MTGSHKHSAARRLTTRARLASDRAQGLPELNVMLAAPLAQAARRNTARKEVGRHTEPPCGVGTPSPFSLSQMACKVSPRLRIDLIRRASFGEIDGGLPSRTPCFLFIARASRVR